MTDYRSSVEAQGTSVLGQAANDAYEAVVDDEHMDEDAVWLREQRLFNTSLHWLRRPSVIMVGMCLFMFTFSMSAAEPTRQMITFKLACNAVVDNSGKCDPLESQLLVSKLQQVYALATGITTIFASGKIGPLSDQYGRKVFMIFIILCNLLGKCLKYWVMSAFPLLHFALMVGTEILANLCGGVVAYLTLASCYVSDISETHQRIYYLGINMAALFIGMSTGPLLGKLLLSYSTKSQSLTQLGRSTLAVPSTQSSISPGEFLPLKLELAMLAILSTFIMFVLPESRSEKARRKSRSLSRSSLLSSLTELSTQPEKSFFSVFNFLKPIRLIFYPKDSVPRLKHPAIDVYRLVVIILVLADCIMTSIAIPMGEIYVLYGIFKFDWSAQDLGTLLAVTCSSRAFTLIILSPLISHQFFQKFCGFKVHKTQFDSVDYAMISFAFIFEIIGMGLIASAPSGFFFLVSLVFTSLGALAGPALNSSIVKFYPELKTGELFGGMALIKNFFQILSPVLMLAIYKKSLSKWRFPQAVFLFVSGCFVIFWASVSYARYVLAKHCQISNPVSRAPSSTLLLLAQANQQDRPKDRPLDRSAERPIDRPNPEPRRPLNSSRNASFLV